MNTRRALFAAAVALAVAACTDAPVAVETDLEPQFARGGVQLPSITGGGITLNNNSGFGEFVAIGGFSARATGPAEEGISPARGQVQAKSVPADLGTLHAEVVCIANLGRSGDVDGGGDPDNDVWEIRIRVTKSSSLPVGFHGSIFVQDNGRGSAVDFADENFDPPPAADNGNCGETTKFELEPVLRGSITVRD